MSWQRSLSCMTVRVPSWQIANVSGPSATTLFTTTYHVHGTVYVAGAITHAKRHVHMQGTGVASTVRFPRSSPQVYTNYTSHVSGRTVQFRNATTWCWSPDDLESIQALQIGGDGAAAESAGVGWKIAVITISAHALLCVSRDSSGESPCKSTTARAHGTHTFGINAELR